MKQDKQDKKNTRVIQIPNVHITSPITSDMTTAEEGLEEAKKQLNELRTEEQMKKLKKEEEENIASESPKSPKSPRSPRSPRSLENPNTTNTTNTVNNVSARNTVNLGITPQEIMEKIRISLDQKREEKYEKIKTKEEKLLPSTENIEILFNESSTVIDDLIGYYEKFIQKIVDCTHIAVLTKLKGFYLHAQLQLFLRKTEKIKKIEIPHEELETRCHNILKVPFSRIYNFSQKFDLEMYEKHLDKEVSSLKDQLLRECSKDSLKCNIILNDQNNKKVIMRWNTFFKDVTNVVESKVTNLLQGYKKIFEDFQNILLKIIETVQNLPFSIPEQTTEFSEMLQLCFKEDNWKIRSDALLESIPEFESFIAPTAVITESGPTAICSYLKLSNPKTNYNRCGSIQLNTEMISVLQPILQSMKDQFLVSVQSLSMLESKTKCEYSTMYTVLNNSTVTFNKNVHFVRQDIIQSILKIIASSDKFLNMNHKKFTIVILKTFITNQTQLLKTIDHLTALCNEVFYDLKTYF